MQRCVVVGGADINRYDEIRAYFREDDFFVFCDCGLRHSEHLGAKPDLIVGDFDSYSNPEIDVETIVLPCEKDDTDTVFAVKEALKRGFDEFLLVGAVGGRFDHSFGNISILLFLDSLGKKAILADDYSEMEIVGSEPKYVEDRFPYFSLLNISGVARGISIENAKYCLENGEIKSEYQYGISNETPKGKIAKISVFEGRLLLVRDRRG